MTQYIIAHDVGTGGNKAVLVDTACITLLMMRKGNLPMASGLMVVCNAMDSDTILACIMRARRRG